MRTGREVSQCIAAVILCLALGCSDSNEPGESTRPPENLNVVGPASGAPPLFNSEVSFYAHLLRDSEGRIYFQNTLGGPGAEFARLRIDAGALLALPNGSPILLGDSVLITMRVIDPAQFLVELEPSGLQFNPLKPATLRISYAPANGDLNGDGVVDSADAAIEAQLAIWRQENAGEPFLRLNSLVLPSLDEAETALLGFSRYAIAY